MTSTQGPPLVVLAAGMSTRYGRLKQVDPLGPCGAAIMDYNVYDAARAGFSEAVFVIREKIEEQVRAHVAEVIGDSFPTRFVLQGRSDLPEGYRTPPDRRKPWGTGHAVLAAAELVSGPFGVCNADDLYGADAFQRLHAHLTKEPPTSEAALVGYTLSETLSVSGVGGVARGVCVMGRDQRLERVTEVREIRSVDGWISGVDPDGEVVELRGREIVSMNLWGFSDPVMATMKRQFRRFLDRWGANTEAEFLLSTAINGQIETGSIGVTVLQAEDEWFGVTHANDRAEARAALQERVEGGAHPEDLTAAFASLR
ncbi:MAG: hypothetical protein RH859_06540 [Longimicrobiales bacterium]